MQLPLSYPLAVLFLLLACRPDPLAVLPPDSASPADTADSAAPTGPVDYADPIVRGLTLSLEVSGPELTDAAFTGTHLLLAGQEQTRDGGLWSFDLTDPDAPSLLGRTTTWHIQRLCFDGTDPWGITRGGELMRLSIAADTPTITGTWGVGSEGAGVDCAPGRLAWAVGSGGAAVADIGSGGPEAIRTISGEVRDVLLEGDRLWALGYERLTAWDIGTDGLSEIGSVALSGTCLDLAAGADWLAVACGSGGVSLVDREHLSVLGVWSGHASVRAVDVAGDQVLAAAWTDLLSIDAADPTAPWLRGSEPAGSAVMAVAAGEDGRAYVADWSQPFVVTLSPADAPEVRASPPRAVAGGSVRLTNDGPQPLWLGTPSAGTLSAPGPLAPGESATWDIPQEAADLTLPTDDPDEQTFSLPLQSGKLQVGQPAPDFIESDLEGTVWELAALRGEVVFLGLFQDG